MSLALENTAIRDKLNKICASVKDRIVNQPSVVDSSKRKWFGTFPYPYMNGTLHLGHAYTATKVDFMARFMKSHGYNVLFPFAFHATGAPIYACANKIRRELETVPGQQTAILLDMGVPAAELPRFADPEYWVTYFTKRGAEDIREIGLISDMRRSFYTTRMNPAYDSFVRWQFEHLLRDGYVVKGKRHVIYSVADGQPCADHDRSTGEGVEPARYNMTTVGNYLITGNPEDKHVFINSALQFVSFVAGDKIYIASQQFYNNYSKQVECGVATPVSTEQICADLVAAGYVITETTRYLHASGLYARDSAACEADTPCAIPYYEPASTVISRSGDTCVVALVDQWFIDYGNEKVKNIVRNYISNDPIYGCSLFEGEGDYAHAVEWLNMWPCSRSFGLGTTLPGTDYLIDSLSDSTIYMAYYTTAHLINELPASAIDSALWDHVFLEGPCPKSIKTIKHMQTINKMRDEFAYWYPLDMRISGKDLVSNHLTMCLFNHAMIWCGSGSGAASGFTKLPRCFRANGYLMLNGRKMSKSEGNFMTMRAACDKYSPDVVRFVLADNDGFDDANFNEKNANATIMRFDTELKWISENSGGNGGSGSSSDIWDHIFEDTLAQSAYDACEAYRKGHFRTVCKMICGLTTARQAYVTSKKAAGSESIGELFNKYIKTYLTISEPIMPHLCQYVVEKYVPDHVAEWPTIQPSLKWKFYQSKINEGIDSVNSEIARARKKSRAPRKFQLFYAVHNNEIQEQIINHIKAYDGSTSWDEYMTVFGTDSAIRQFASFARDMSTKYGSDYFDWIVGTTLIETVMENIPIHVKNSIEFVAVDTSFDVYPGKFVFKAVAPPEATSN